MSLTSLRVSDTLLLRAMFRLPEDVTLHDAHVDRDGNGTPTLVLTVDLPDAPEGATSVDVTYTRRHDIPDPVKVTGYRYFDPYGTEITQTEGHP